MDTANLQKPKRLFIIDDSKMMRKVIADIFADDELIEVVGEAADGEEATAGQCRRCYSGRADASDGRFDYLKAYDDPDTCSNSDAQCLYPGGNGCNL